MKQLKISNRITNRESIALDKYFNDINKIDLLTPSQESELARRIKEGDKEALEILTKSNLKFVVSVAKQYQNQGLSLPDLINEGNIGLMKAAKRFDESRGFKFISYAVWWIRQSIISAIIEYSRLVRLPMSKVNGYRKVNEAFVSFVQKFERDPTHAELADLLDMKSDDIRAILNGTRHLSMDAPLSNDEGASNMYEVFLNETQENPDDVLMLESFSEEVRMSLANLSPRESQILSDHFGLNGKGPLSLDEVGDRFGLSRERVRQLKDRALNRLRKKLRNSNLKSYLGS